MTTPDTTPAALRAEVRAWRTACELTNPPQQTQAFDKLAEAFVAARDAGVEWYFEEAMSVRNRLAINPAPDLELERYQPRPYQTRSIAFRLPDGMDLWDERHLMIPSWVDLPKGFERIAKSRRRSNRVATRDALERVAGELMQEVDELSDKTRLDSAQPERLLRLIADTMDILSLVEVLDDRLDAGQHGVRTALERWRLETDGRIMAASRGTFLIPPQNASFEKHLVSGKDMAMMHARSGRVDSLLHAVELLTALHAPDEELAPLFERVLNSDDLRRGDGAEHLARLWRCARDKDDVALGVEVAERAMQLGNDELVQPTLRWFAAPTRDGKSRRVGVEVKIRLANRAMECGFSHLLPTDFARQHVIDTLRNVVLSNEPRSLDDDTFTRATIERLEEQLHRDDLTCPPGTIAFALQAGMVVEASELFPIEEVTEMFPELVQGLCTSAATPGSRAIELFCDGSGRPALLWKLNNTDPEAAQLLARQARDALMRDEAVLRQVVEADPRCAIALNSLATFDAALQSPDEHIDNTAAAFQALSFAHEAQPNDPVLASAYARALIDVNQPGEAVSACERALADVKDPQQALRLHRVAMNASYFAGSTEKHDEHRAALVELGDEETLGHWANEIVETRPDFAFARMNLAADPPPDRLTQLGPQERAAFEDLQISFGMDAPDRSQLAPRPDDGPTPGDGPAPDNGGMPDF